MPKEPANPDSSQDALPSMDAVLAQTLSMDAHPSFQCSPNFNLVNGDYNVNDDSLWQSLGLSSSSAEQPLPSLFNPFNMPTLNSISMFAPVLSTSLESNGFLLDPDLTPQLPRTSEQTGTEETSGVANWVKHPNQAARFIDEGTCDLFATIKACRHPKPSKPYLLTDKSRPSELQLCKAVLHPSDGSEIAVVATANRNARKHFVVALDMSLLRSSPDPDPNCLIKGMSPIPSYARELHWVSERCLLTAHGTDASLLDINDHYQMTEKFKITWAHTDEIREISFDPKNNNLFAAGGFDRILSINDITRSFTTIAAVRLDDVIGSVRWGSFDNQSVTMTTDDGRFFQFDPRTAMRKAALFIDAQKLHLYAHCVFDPNYILLGFGDGEILQVDIRKNVFVQGTKDPSLHSIGDMLYNPSAQTFLFSGKPEISLWRYDPAKSVALACVNTRLPSSNSYCHAIYGKPSGTIIKTTGAGIISISRHDFCRSECI